VAAFRWLLVGTVAWTSVSVTWSYANASGRPQIGVPIFTAAAVTDVVLNVMLLGRLGIVGAGIAATVSYWIAAILFLRLFCVLEACTLRDALVVRSSDLRHIARVTRDLARALVRWRRRQRAPERVRE
jgi:Na+-driven multidrug efflux pump